MADREKLKRMWQDIETMDETQIMEALGCLHVSISKEDLIDRLSKTYNDLEVADYLFEIYPVDDKDSPYPKEFVDEAVTRLARLHSFPFTHYGILSQDLQSLHNPLLSEDVKQAKRTECFQKFFQLCKRFHLTYFDNVVYTIHDNLDMGKEFLNFLTVCQAHGEVTDHRLVTQMIERFFQTFAEMNPWIEEQLQYVQAESFIALKSSKGERQFDALIKSASDSTEAIYHYANCYRKRDPKRSKNIVNRYQKQIQKDSEYYERVMAFLHT